MAQTSRVTMRMDIEDKKKAEVLFSSLGLNMTTAFNMFIKQAIMCQGLPFTVSLVNQSDDYFYSKSNTDHLDHSLAQLKNAKTHELMEIPEDE